MALLDGFMSIVLLIIIAIIGFKILKNILHIVVLVVILALALQFFGVLGF
ncbi:MAG TPA: hypothetical protein VJH90_01405 [archaeon]|nr:hypothetical protein [archaeon]